MQLMTIPNGSALGLAFGALAVAAVVVPWVAAMLWSLVWALLNGGGADDA